MIGSKEKKFFTVKDVSASEFIRAYADYLKKNNKLELPPWLVYAKTSIANELAPQDDDWIYIRAAALARKIYIRPHTGVGTLKHLFGGKKRNGVVCPRH